MYIYIYNIHEHLAVCITITNSAVVCPVIFNI